MKNFILLIVTLLANSLFGQPLTIDPYFVHSTDTISEKGPSNITRHIHQDKKGNIWLATWQGIIKFDGKLFTNYTLKDNLVPIHVFSICEDRSGNLWFGTIRGGAYRYDGKNFKLITSYDGLPDDQIGCIMEDNKGRMWFGTEKGLSCMDTMALNPVFARQRSSLMMGPDLPSKKGFTNYFSNPGLSGNRINWIMQDKTGLMWIATRTGVSCFDGNNFTAFEIAKNQPFTNVRCIKEDRNGKIWIGGMEGLYSYDPSASDKTKALIKHLPNFIGNIFEDKEGNLWMSAGEMDGTSKMKLYKYDGQKFSVVLQKNGERDFQVFEITQDQQNNIWFGTMMGPGRYDGKNFTYFHRLD